LIAEGWRVGLTAHASLAGSVCLVTGASSGIGRAVARTLAGPDVTVAVVARRADKLAALAREIDQQGGSALPVEADLSDATECAHVVENVLADTGRLDVLVTNAGIMSLGTAETADPADWTAMIAVNVVGTLAITHAALPALLEAAQGPRGVSDIVTLGSLSGRFPSAGRAVYSATKAAGRAFAEALRQEIAPRGVRVSTIEPGLVRTGLRDHLDPSVVQTLRDTVDPPESLEPGDVANLVRYLVTAPPSVHISEAVIRPTSQIN
jgi:NADP-dependent 3-hydroxy acid dehydrogenase YdfG